MLTRAFAPSINRCMAKHIRVQYIFKKTIKEINNGVQRTFFASFSREPLHNYFGKKIVDIIQDSSGVNKGGSKTK